MIPGGGGAMFGGLGQLGTFAAHVEIGVAPAVQFARALQGLARSAGLGVFAGVMHEHDGQLELPLQFPQIWAKAPRCDSCVPLRKFQPVIVSAWVGASEARAGRLRAPRPGILPTGG